jgi:hypothetical protein
MLGLFLYVIATILFLPLTILNIICVLWKNVKAKGFFNVIQDYFFQGAIDIDKFGNHNFRTLFNVILRKRNGYVFGFPDETISSVLGKNQAKGTLSWVGISVAFILDSLDKNHCKKSIR